MYANKTHYQSLYHPSYFGKSSGATSFNGDAFTQSVIDFCSQHSLRHVVDVGSGSGALATCLRQAGLAVLACNFDPVTEDGIHFSLAGSADDAQRVLSVVQAATGGAPWLLTCLDVLEHIDIEDVPSAVQNLRILCNGPFLVSISTRPSSADNKYHATVLPKATWLEILKMAGFTIDGESIFEHTRIVRKCWPSDESLRLVAYWAQMDPFNDVNLGEPDYVLAAANSFSLMDPEFHRCVEELLDIAYLKVKRAQFGLTNVPRVGLNIHHPQDFFLLKPLLEVLPRKDVVVLIRREMLESDERALICGILARCGVEVILYERCAQIPWEILALRYVVTPAESNAAGGHVLSRQVVEAAKLHGIHTIQLQHGVWIEPFPERVLDFGSESIFAWGASYARLISSFPASLSGCQLGALMPHDWQNFLEIGGAKFVDMKIPPSSDLIRWRLGVPRDQFRAVALLGTNLRWGRHQVSSGDVHEKLRCMIQQAPDVFFIVKLHPSERAIDAELLKMPNSLVLDDILLGIMGVSINRLIPAVDIVISSLSTLLLDAAVAGKPCIQYDTENSLDYQGIRPIAVELIPEVLRHAPALPIKNKLVESYAEASSEPFYAHLASFLQTTKAAPSMDVRNSSASFYSVACSTEDYWLASREAQARLSHKSVEFSASERGLKDALLALEAAKAELARACGDRDAALSAAQDQEAAAQDREIAAQVREAAAIDEIRALRSTLSWRITSPIRLARRLLLKGSM